jgi:hypothetical protein
LKTGSAVNFNSDMDKFLGSTIQQAMYQAMLGSMTVAS